MIFKKNTKYLVFDTETTDLMNADVIQFSALKFEVNEEGEMITTNVISEYFMTDKVIAEEALRVHGLDKTLLMRLSDGKYFTDIREKIVSLLDSDTIVLGYNTNFDIRAINGQLSSNGMKPIFFGTIVSHISLQGKNSLKYLDVMHLSSKLYGRNKKLVEMFENHTEISYKDISETHKSLIEKFDLKTKPQAGAHDALYDCLMTFSVFKENYKEFVV